MQDTCVFKPTVILHIKPLDTNYLLNCVTQIITTSNLIISNENTHTQLLLEALCVYCCLSTRGRTKQSYKPVDCPSTKPCAECIIDMCNLTYNKVQLNSRLDRYHRHSRSRLLTHGIGGMTCMINPRWCRNQVKNYKTLQGNQCFSQFKTSCCLESLRINIFWKQLIIAEVLSTICVISAEFLVKISLVKCVVNWSLGQFETLVKIRIFDRLWPLGCYCDLQLS